MTLNTSDNLPSYPLWVEEQVCNTLANKMHATDNKDKMWSVDCTSLCNTTVATPVDRVERRDDVIPALSRELGRGGSDVRCQIVECIREI